MSISVFYILKDHSHL